MKKMGLRILLKGDNPLGFMLINAIKHNSDDTLNCKRSY